MKSLISFGDGFAGMEEWPWVLLVPELVAVAPYIRRVLWFQTCSNPAHVRVIASGKLFWPDLSLEVRFTHYPLETLFGDFNREPSFWFAVFW